LDSKCKNAAPVTAARSILKGLVKSGDIETRMTDRICLWSGPRNVSTALMYSFAQRADTKVVDEPLYAHYLLASGARHPGRELVLADQEEDGRIVVDKVFLGPCRAAVLFIKSMAHHLVDLDWGFLYTLKNVLLTRSPREMVPSLAQKLPMPTLPDTGYDKQIEILEFLKAGGREPIVLDAAELLSSPRQVLGQLCDALGLSFDEAMLRWEPGARPEDGVWADIWYDAVHRSRGFAPHRPKTEPLPESLRPLVDECQAYYDVLYDLAIKARQA
jgi:hypothetical protein